MSRRRRAYPLLVELSVVMVGVLAALAFDEWREEQQREDLLVNVLNGLLVETRGNLQAAEDVVEYHRRMRDVFDDYANRLRETGKWQYPEEATEGMRLAELSDAAYQSGLMTGLLPLVQYDTLEAMSRVYGQIDAYFRNNERYALATLQTDFRDGSRYLRILNFHFGALADSEATLIEAIKALESRLEQEIRERS
ncbi:MAG: hypothetical protein QNJ40_06470 [Xanthomonadales bacterium]|nr:hypothetical protein [Xanthomonadales bacterium]